jgi:hypothetical protein
MRCLRQFKLFRSLLNFPVALCALCVYFLCLQAGRRVLFFNCCGLDLYLVSSIYALSRSDFCLIVYCSTYYGSLCRDAGTMDMIYLFIFYARPHVWRRCGVLALFVSLTPFVNWGVCEQKLRLHTNCLRASMTPFVNFGGVCEPLLNP